MTSFFLISNFLRADHEGVAHWARLPLEHNKLVQNQVRVQQFIGHQSSVVTISAQSGDESDFGRDGRAILAPARPQTRAQVKRPPMYTVLLLNDDYTPMDFVVHILQKFFQKEYDEAMRIMLQVHQQGAGIAGTFSHEIAETKVSLVNDYSKSQKHPLKATLETA